MCQLRAGPGPELAWRCIGNQTAALVQETSGKWFKTEFAKTETERLSRPVNDDLTPPKTDSFHRHGGDGANDLVQGDQGLDVWDMACTGVNHTTFSTSWYRAAEQIERGERPVDAAPCWRPNTIPVQIQSVDDWLENGCSRGFLCKNNTVNSLPQFCPPITECQISRLFGVACASPFVEGENFAMGPFEPVICPAGRYCPPELEGKEMIVCPPGTYCQPGSAAPTPCAAGSNCPAGSTFELFIIPAVALLGVDLIIIMLVVAFALRGRNRRQVKRRPETRMSADASVYSMTIDGKEYQSDDDVPFDGGSNQAFIESMRRATASASHVGLSFGYTHLGYQPSGANKPILQNITGTINRGSLSVVMGGSGAGKSTFINVLMGKIEPTSGSLKVNDAPGRVARYKKLVGYVPQDDVVSAELTVRENIMHSARIRLPRSWTNADRLAHVDAVLECLELLHVQHSIVGTIGKPIISGGQRKRVSIGMELAAAPMAIFLDEPTSGLDATAASSIMRTLRALSRLGITVIATIHQPRREIFAMIDDLILLANGQLLYQGPGASAKSFFEAQGFRFPRHANAGDVLTDIITGNGRPYKSTGDISQYSLVNHWTGHGLPDTFTPPSTSRSSARGRQKTAGIPRCLLRKRHAPFLRQLQYNLNRAVIQQTRTKATLLYELGLAALAGFLLGLAESPKKGILFTGLYKPPYDVLSVSSDFKSAPEMALLTAIAIGLVSAAPGVKVFSEELLLHRREAEAGHSRLAYFLAKSIAVVPRMAMACLHFTTPLMLMAVPIIPYSSAFMVNLLYFYCIYGLASGVSMVVRREDAPLFATMFALVVGILSGAAPPLKSVVEWKMEWLWRASPGVWLAEYYFGQLVSPFQGLYNVELASDLVGFAIDKTWRNLGVLAAIGTAYRVLAFTGLVFGKRLRV